MRFLLAIFLLFSLTSYSQYKNYQLINDGKDTVDRIDMNDRKQGEWIVRVASLRGEPGYEEEGVFVNDRKEGPWRVYNLMGDLIGIENYRWGNKDGIAQYFNMNGELRAEQSWKALNPDKVYDTIQVEDLNKLDSYHEVVVKNEGASLKHGAWKYYDENGMLIREENYVLGKLEHGNTTAAAEPAEAKKVPKPKEVLDFEKQKKGKKKIRYQDGSTQ